MPALDFICGVPKAVVPDNLKTRITTPSRWVNSPASTAPINQSLADHCDFVVQRARFRKPRDKTKSLPRRRPGSRQPSTSSEVCWGVGAIGASCRSLI